MTAVLAALLFLLVHARRRMRWWHLPVALATALLAGAALIALCALLYPHLPNHPGALGREIAAHGTAPLWTMIARKWLIRRAHVFHQPGVDLSSGRHRLPRRSIPGSTAVCHGVGNPAPARLWEAIFVAWWCALLAGGVNDNGMGLTGIMWLTLAPAGGTLLPCGGHNVLVATPEGQWYNAAGRNRRTNGHRDSREKERLSSVRLLVLDGAPAIPAGPRG